MATSWAVTATVRFYGEVLGLEPGPRPNFSIGGAWLYCDGDPIVHIVEAVGPMRAPGPLDHVGFMACGLDQWLSKLSARNIPYDIRWLPCSEPDCGDWQLFFHDPGGARLEMRFSAMERPTQPTDRPPIEQSEGV